MQVIHAPVFHGLAFSIAVDLERPVEIVALEEALTGEHVDIVLEDTDSPSNLAATGQNDILVRLRPEPLAAQLRGPLRASGYGQPSTIFASTRKMPSQCALDLRRLRPQGTVQ